MKYKIYKHTSPSGKVYIGQTCQDNVIKRWRNGGKGYFSTDKYGNFKQPAIVNAINKYPWNTWNHEIIDECESKEEADLLEIKYIKEYNSTDKNFGYNITEGGSHSGHPVSEETKEKLSEAIKNKWKTDIDYRTRIINSLKGSKMHENTKKALIKANTGRIQSDETKDKISKANGTIVLQFSLEGEFISEYQSASKAAQQINKTCASITNQCKGITKKCGNYLFVYKKDYNSNPSIIEDKIKDLSNRKTAAKPIIQLTIDGDIIKEWPSTTEAAKQLGVAISSINNCLRGINKTCKNSKWIYK